MRVSKGTLWKVCCFAASLIAIVGLTPLSIPEGEVNPKLLALPYPLWVGILNCVILLLLTIIGTVVHPGKRQEQR